MKMVSEINQQNKPPSATHVLTYFFVYFIYLLIFTLTPFEFSITWFQDFLAADVSDILAYLFSFGLLDIVQNILLFVPFGVLLFQFVSIRASRWHIRKNTIPIIAGFILSGAIEVAQLFLDRSSSVIDLTMNVCGTWLGFLGAKKMISVWQYMLSRLDRQRKNILHFLVVLFYGVFMCMLMFFPVRINHLENWSEQYDLCVGNEATMDRPWKGKLYLIALYNRALTVSEIRELYQLGIEKRNPCPDRIALYTFSEDTGDTIYDLSDRGEPLHLEAQGVKPLAEERGIQIEESILKSFMPGKKIVEAVRETSQLSVEVWLQTTDLSQSGPARIVSLSENPDNRNFTLGQAGNDMHFRVRTPLTGPNGSKIYLIARSTLCDSQRHHFVATFNHGVERLIVDGTPAGDMIRGDMDYFPDLFCISDNPITIYAFYFALVFPLSFFIYGLFRKYRLFFTLLTVLGLIGMIEWIYFFKFGQPFGYIIFLLSLFTALFGYFLRFFLAKK